MHDKLDDKMSDDALFKRNDGHKKQSGCNNTLPSTDSLTKLLLTLFFFSSSLLCLVDLVNGQESLELKYRFEEEQSAGAYVGDVVANANLGKIYDAASLQQLQFKFLRHHQQSFMIDNSTGIVRTNSQIDREAICPGAINCDVRIDVVVQLQTNIRIIRATVTILDVNDNSPRFDNEAQIVEVSESAAVGTILFVPNAVDLDSPVLSIQMYKLLSDSDRFELVDRGRRLDGASDVKLLLAKNLDRELVSEYHMQILAIDGGNPSKSGSMDITVRVLDVNDNNPVFESDNYTITIIENIPKHTTILRLRAFDKDIGLNGEVVYYLSSPTIATYGHLFGMNNKTGDLYVKGELDFEESSMYYLMAFAQDLGPDSVPVNVPMTVLVTDVNDNSPDITIVTLSPTPGAAVISEDSMLGSFVAHLTVIDRDSGNNGKFECHLNDTQFQIVEVTDVEVEYQIITAALLDREMQSQYGVTVTCMDFGEEMQESIKHIVVHVTDVNDNDPIFGQSVYRGELIENNYIGAILMQVNASDLDSGQNGNIIYSLSGDAAKWFNVEPEVGIIKAAISLDRESAELIRFHVVAHDEGIPSRSSSSLVLITILDVNDERPVFSLSGYSFAVQENQEPGTEVGMVTAYDADSSVYGEVTYSILPTHGSDLFDINHKTGMIVTLKMLDRETQPVYHISVFASDRGIPPLSSTASIAIYVADENDNAPVFDYPFHNNNTIYVSNRTPKGHVITRLRAHDMDVGQNGKVTFDVTKETKTEMFDLDLELGTVIVMEDLTEFDGRQFLLEFVAKDEGFPQKIAFARLNVIVNRSVVFPAERSNESTDRQSLTIILVLTIVSGVIIIILIIAIIVVCRQDKDKQTHTYNCRTETLRMFSRNDTKPSQSDCSDCSGAAEHGSSTDDKTKAKELSMSMEDHGMELSPQSWPSSIDPQTLQNPQASSSLLTNTSSVKMASNGRVSQQSTMTSKLNKNGYNSQTIPLLQRNKDVEVKRLLKALQHDHNDGDSIHSGDGSYTDSGHGPSEEGETHIHNNIRPSTNDQQNNGPLQVGFDRCMSEHGTAEHRKVNTSYHSNGSSNQVVPNIETNCSYSSSHSYSSQKPELSTFGPRCLCHRPSPEYNTSSTTNIINLPEMRGRDELDQGFIEATSGARSDYSITKSTSVLSPPVSFKQSANISMTKHDNSVHFYSNRFVSPGSISQQLNTLNNQRNVSNNFDSTSKDNRFDDRMLNNSSTINSDCTSVYGQYSCADVSAVLRNSYCTPKTQITSSNAHFNGANSTLKSESYVIDPEDLCNQIDDLFFKDNMPLTFKH